jgi:IrrE N-terminal-like domain
VRYTKDMTGRFAMRPHYEPAELDRECEKILSIFFGGSIPTLIDTDSLARLIERDTSDFDPGADLSHYGPDVEGVTEFLPNRKPKVRIVADLAYDEVRQNRYRTTLTHEYGHVHFHAHLFATEPRGTDLFSSAPGKGGVQVCKRDGILGARKTDWMEWQAGYVCGALLMPITRLRRVVSGYQETRGLFGPVMAGSEHGVGLINTVRTEFQVSADAARVRLAQLSHLQAQDRGRSLFG